MISTSPTSATATPIRVAWEWLWPILLALAVMGLAIFVLCSLFATLDQPTALYPVDY